MKVLKFGGTSVGTPQRMKNVVELVRDGQPKVVVLSAMSGTTNTLVEIADYFRKNNAEAANNIINQLRLKYKQHIRELYATEEFAAKAQRVLDDIFATLRSFTHKPFSDAEEKVVLAQGELMSTNMVNLYMQEQGIDSYLLPALDFMKLDRNEEPDSNYIHEHLQALLDAEAGHEIYMTQGFICRDDKGAIANLQRGGSDYTACLIGASMKSEEIQIWTDIDGMHNNDPRYVEHTEPVRQLNFDEAAELAYFGAKILHPTCIQPARFAGVPVRLLNTMAPEAPGTIINNEMQKGSIKAIAAKDNITVIKIVSNRMLLATGYLAKVFEIFSKYKTSIDMVTTSEVAISLSIDNTSRLVSILEELKEVGTVNVDSHMTIICVVGDFAYDYVGYTSRVMQALSNIPVRMIAYGASNHSISYLVHENDKTKALQALSDALFSKPSHEESPRA